ncbi:unnamed protein product, partial [marine sediment metagenome]
MKSKKLIAILDNEPEFRKKFQKTLTEIGAAGEYDLKLFSAESPEELADCVADMEEYWEDIVAILMDVVMFELESIDHVLDSISEIGNVRLRFPDTPIILITKHIYD